MILCHHKRDPRGRLIPILTRETSSTKHDPPPGKESAAGLYPSDELWADHEKLLRLHGRVVSEYEQLRRDYEQLKNTYHTTLDEHQNTITYLNDSISKQNANFDVVAQGLKQELAAEIEKNKQLRAMSQDLEEKQSLLNRLQKTDDKYGKGSRDQKCKRLAQGKSTVVK